MILNQIWNMTDSTDVFRNNDLFTIDKKTLDAAIHLSVVEQNPKS